MEWALWQHFGNRMGAHSGAPIPAVFAHRIKRMLDLDTAEQANVFAAESSEGRGHVAGYDDFGVFLMGLALILLDAGLKQSDALFLLRHVKEKMREPYKRIKESPPSPGQMIFWKDSSNSPCHPYHPTHADCSVFLLIRKIEMLECWPPRKRADGPFILGPIFCYGLEELRKELDGLNWGNPSKMVIELADMAVILCELLKKAPIQKRGRKTN